MSSATEPMTTPDVRTLVRWGLPLHWVAPAACGVLGVLLLLLGGTPAFFGGWWLATAFPVAIGGFHRARLAALVPVALWIVWAIVGVAAGSGAGLANTPVGIALMLAILGGAATLLAQRAVFPATDPEVWEHHGDAATKTEADTGDRPVTVPPLLEVDEDEELDPSLADAFEVDDDETEPAVEPEADDEPEADAEPEPTPVAVAAEAETPAHELPVGSDPSPLDEGGHVTEFQAISED